MAPATTTAETRLVSLKGAAPHLLDKVLARNQEVEAVTSPLDQPALQALIDASFLALADPSSGSFLITMAPDADYQSANYLWVQQRLQRFAYIDRIVVAPQARGQGLARRFYAALEQEALARGLLMLACEVNCKPDNPVSHAFHKALGFTALYDRDMTEAGQAGKWVRYYAKLLA